MKLQHLAIIFIIIIIPISVTMSEYIQSQIDTITLQTAYTQSLNNATYDALKAFQINSINNKYSGISDSKIRDIEASVNTFYNSLGTSMETYVSSREQLSTFIPALLFTLYDGYYINSSYDNVYSNNGNKVTISDGKNYQEGLKPYIYYSCNYRLNNGKIITVNYTLDNAITVYGDFGSGYETRSGYLIKLDDVTSINESSKTLYYKGVKIEPEILTEHLLTLDSNSGEAISGDYNYIIYNNQKVYQDTDGRYFWYQNYKKTYLQSEAQNVIKYVQENKFRSISAYEYFKEAYEFSDWLINRTPLGKITKANMVQDDGFTADTGNNRIFDTTAAGNDPMSAGSTFNSHRMAVIRKSIETNLTTAIANYNLQSASNYEFVMPKLDDESWYRITNNVSLVSFMQGMPIGQKFYNNYSVIANTKNEEVINQQSIYILAEDGNGNLEYHQPGCEKLENQRNMMAYNALSFFRQTVKVNEVKTQYFYPHQINSKNGKTLTACYDCIVHASPSNDIDSITDNNVKKAYFSGLARERQDLYKSSFN